MGKKPVTFGIDLVLLKDGQIIGKASTGACLAAGQEQTLTLYSDDPYQAAFDEARVLIDRK